MTTPAATPPATAAEMDSAQVVVIGGGVIGVAILHALAHRDVDVLLVEREAGLAYGASGTNSGVLHTGFDSAPGELETDLILRSAALRPAVLEALGVPVLHCGAELVPQTPGDDDTIAGLAANARRNGVEVHVRESDGALLVPGESVTDPVAFTRTLARSAEAAGGRIATGAEVIAVDVDGDGFAVRTADGRSVTARAVVNAAGLHGDEVAAFVAPPRFEIYPRKGEFLVFGLPDGRRLDHIVLPVPTKRTKGVLVFPTLDGRVVAGPTAVDLEDKSDWRVGPGADDEILAKAASQFPALKGLTPEFRYAGLRPAGRDVNYVIESSPASPRFVDVAAIRSTGLSASLGIGAHVAELLASVGVEQGAVRPPTRVEPVATEGSWWRRTAEHTADGPSGVSTVGTPA